MQHVVQQQSCSWPKLSLHYDDGMERDYYCIQENVKLKYVVTHEFGIGIGVEFY